MGATEGNSASSRRERLHLYSKRLATAWGASDIQWDICDQAEHAGVDVLLEDTARVAGIQ